MCLMCRKRPPSMCCNVNSMPKETLERGDRDLHISLVAFEGRCEWLLKVDAVALGGLLRLSFPFYPF